MDDLISRQAAIEALGDMPMSWADTDAEIQAQEDWKQHREALLNLPTAEKRGEWIPVTNGRGGHECDQCHEYAPSWATGEEYLTNYCPNCGARMEESEESDGKI